MTRRDFCMTVAAARLLRAASGLEPSRISAIGDEIGHTPREVEAFAKEYGFSAIEMRASLGTSTFQYYEMMPPQELRKTAAQMADAGLTPTVLDSSLLKYEFPGSKAVTREDFYDKYFAKLGLSQEQLFEKRMDQLNRFLDAAHALGVHKIRIFSFWRVADPASIAPKVAEILHEMADVAGKSGVQLLVENEGSTNVATSGGTAAMMRRVPSKALGINWDPRNGMSLEKVPYPDGYAVLPKDRIGNVHMKGRDLIPTYTGRLDWGTIMRVMVRDGYQGKFSLETHRGQANIAASRTSMQEIMRFVRES